LIFQECETTEQQNAQLLQEIETLKGQLSATHSAWTDSKADVQTKEAQYVKYQWPYLSISIIKVNVSHRIVSLEAQLRASQRQVEELHAKVITILVEHCPRIKYPP
jgi:peptidoglycan hydrolase CwlO-like protein